MTLPKDDSLLLLHNPDCSKSRAAHDWLVESGHAFTAREYLLDPLDAAEIAELADRMGMPLGDWVRLSAEEVEAIEESGAGLIAHVVRHPESMQRPILVSSDGGVVGRPLAALTGWCRQRDRRD